MTAQVIAPTKSDPIPDLKHLTVVQAPDDENLAPLDARTRLTAKIPTTGLLPDDKLQVFLVGGPGSDPRGSYASPLLDVGSSNPRTLNLNKDVVAFLLGNIMTLTFKITRAGVTSPESEPLELKVLDLPADALEKGRIFGRNDDGTGPDLDLTTDTEDRTVRIEIWPLIAVGQWLWIVLTGEDENGDPYELTLFEGQVYQALITLGYIDVPALYSWLMLLGDGTIVTLQYRVAFDQVKDESKANLSEVRSYTVKNVVAAKLAITAMMDTRGNLIAKDWATVDTRVILEGTVVRGGIVDVFDGTTLMGQATTTDTQWRFDARGLSVKRYAFNAKMRDGSQPDSDTWGVTVGNPYISGGSTPNGGHSPTQEVFLGGKAARPGQLVRIFYQGQEIKRVSAGTFDMWVTSVTLHSKVNIFEVSGEQEGELRSPRWMMTFGFE